MWDVLYYIRSVKGLLVTSTATIAATNRCVQLIIGDSEAKLDPPGSRAEMCSALPVWQAIYYMQPSAIFNFSVRAEAAPRKPR